MRIGTLLMPTDPWPETVDHARRLEAAGFDHIWVYDHLTWRRYRDRPWFSAVPWLTGLAAATHRIRLGTMVANPNFRHPLTFAKEAMTLDHISNGRLTVGIGAGGRGYDATVLGADPATPRRRADRLGEFLELFDGLLTGTIVTQRGEHYSVDDAVVHPGCVQQPRVPIAVAAGGPRTIGFAAQYGDAWITWGDATGVDLSPAGTERAVRRQLAMLEDRCGAAGRDARELDRIFLIGNTEVKPLVSFEALIDFAGTYSEIGFTDLVFHHPRSDDPVFNEDLSIVDEIAQRLPELRAL